MLPPDTSTTLFPWHVTVLAMQVYGCFPYRMSATSEPPTFSLPLCLWSVSVFLFQAAGICFYFNVALFRFYSPEVGAIVYAATSILSPVAICLTSAALGVRSGKLAQLLHDLSKITGVSPPPNYRWNCKPKTQLFMFFEISLMVVSYNQAKIDYTHITEVLIFMSMTVLIQTGYILPLQLFSMVFGLLGRRLVAATEATVARLSMLLGPDGSFKSDSDVEAAMLALRDLDAVIREVELQRESGARCFFPLVSMRLLLAVLQTIACPYAILSDIDKISNMMGSLCLGYYSMSSFCHVGQTFVNQVSEAEGLLRDVAVKSHIFSFNMKVNQLAGRLSHGLSFDMCGWYKLDYSSLLGLINTMLTYLVIIFQVGGNSVKDH